MKMARDLGKIEGDTKMIDLMLQRINSVDSTICQARPDHHAKAMLPTPATRKHVARALPPASPTPLAPAKLVR